MKGCLPGEGKFAHLPANQTYEWYLAELEKMEEESQQNGEGSPFGEATTSMSTRVSARAVATHKPTRSPRSASRSDPQGSRRSRQGWFLGLCVLCYAEDHQGAVGYQS